MPRTARDLVPSRSLVQALHQSHVFRDVPEEAVLDLAAALRPCAWRPGRVFIGSGTADGGVYFLAAGLVLLCGLSPDGQQIALDLLQAGDLFGIALWTRRSACRSCRSWASRPSSMRCRGRRCAGGWWRSPPPWMLCWRRACGCG